MTTTEQAAALATVGKTEEQLAAEKLAKEKAAKQLRWDMVLAQRAHRSEHGRHEDPQREDCQREDGHRSARGPDRRAPRQFDREQPGRQGGDTVGQQRVDAHEDGARLAPSIIEDPPSPPDREIERPVDDSRM